MSIKLVPPTKISNSNSQEFFNKSLSSNSEFASKKVSEQDLHSNWNRKWLQAVFVYFFGTDYFLDVSNVPESTENVTVKRINFITQNN